MCSDIKKYKCISYFMYLFQLWNTLLRFTIILWQGNFFYCKIYSIPAMINGSWARYNWMRRLTKFYMLKIINFPFQSKYIAWAQILDHTKIQQHPRPLEWKFSWIIIALENHACFIKNQTLILQYFFRWYVGTLSHLITVKWRYIRKSFRSTFS